MPPFDTNRSCYSARFAVGLNSPMAIGFLYPTVSMVSINPQGDDNCPTRDGHPVAPAELDGGSVDRRQVSSIWSIDPSGQSLGTFLRNHAPDIAAMDLSVVPTIGFIQRTFW